MKRNTMRFVAGMLFLGLTLLSRSQCYSEGTEKGPVFHIDQNEYTFPTVFVGKTLSHTFTVSNQGKADLHIKDITHS